MSNPSTKLTFLCSISSPFHHGTTLAEWKFVMGARLQEFVRQPVYDVAQRPFMIIWEVTQACDLACRHCRAEAQPLHDPLALTTAQARSLLAQVAEFERPYPIFIFTGGDPFKREDIFDLIRYSADLGIPTAVSPSGTPLLTEDRLKKVKEAGAKAISLSIDGSTSEKHDDFRRVPGSFFWTVNGWLKAREIGLKVQINTTVTRYNLTDLPRIFRLVKENGAMTWSLFFLVPTGRAQQEDEITPEEYEGVMQWLYDVSKYISAKPTEGHHYKRIVLQRMILEKKRLPAEKYLYLPPIYHLLKANLDEMVATHHWEARETGVHRTPMHINAANGFVFINRRGEVFPSGFLPLSAGNILRRPLTDIYRNSQLFENLRNPNLLEGKCGKCEFATVCGGSRSRAYAVTGNPMAEEPFCIYQPHTFPFQEEVHDLLTQGSAAVE